MNPSNSLADDSATRRGKIARLPLATRKESTASGNIRVTGERTQNGHADRFWALALALHASKKPRVEFGAWLC